MARRHKSSTCSMNSNSTKLAALRKSFVAPMSDGQKQGLIALILHSALSLLAVLFTAVVDYVRRLVVRLVRTMLGRLLDVLSMMKKSNEDLMLKKVVRKEDNGGQKRVGNGEKEAPSEMPSLTVDAGSSDFQKTVTLKARVENLEQMEWALFKLTESIGHIRNSEDIYFDVPFGQMKLRINNPGKDHGELISYKQTNNVGPNFSESRVTEVNGVNRLRNTLALSLTELGSICKKRRVFFKDNIRVNLDEVENLGCFVDIDINALSSKSSAEELLKQAEHVQHQLAIADTQLVPFSYFELYLKAKSADSGCDDESISDASSF